MYVCMYIAVILPCLALCINRKVVDCITSRYLYKGDVDQREVHCLSARARAREIQLRSALQD